MLNNVSVLFPYKPDNGIRDKLFNWIKTFYEALMPEVELYVGECESEPFNRSRAINIAAAQATRDIFVIADTDSIYDPKILVQAIDMLNNYAWVIPYNHWLDLSETSTGKLLAISPQWPLPIKVDYKERLFNKKIKPFSGVIVVPREKFTLVNGFDERFIGWGKEDNAFRDAMDTICGPYGRLRNASVYHLWHPKVGMGGNPNIENHIKLYNRYAQKRGNIEEMKKIINERNVKSEFEVTI